ncbi:phosphotransferase [Pullulanibacillus sp. KACC 23026]|uniref:phosphotransferase n=1 Tax=Pullulanibacillus sp. KACC 23026 TaxID=3028315 RepID=UPI0023AFAC6C|nr:phosphotransferase [Pullulanibacillus sp. KACC 23026]WEG11701.1 phosphotransferase [Pullulanibacillus sp. KACC 23026]
MVNTETIIKDLLKATDRLGLLNTNPEILSDAGNLIVRLTPYPIVARIAKLFEDDDPYFWKNVLLQELEVVGYLEKNNVPVVSFTTQIPAGPHKIGSTWMTLWEYIAPLEIPPLKGKEVINMLNVMIKALNNYGGPLQIFGAWKNVNQAAEYLTKLDDKDKRILLLLKEFEKVDKDIRQLELFPAHGDAHPNNLIPSSNGWRWIDFEDVSLMPKFWDLASFIGNITLFKGLEHPVADYVLNLESVASDKKTFQFVLKARVIMSITTNIALALEGNGDLDFALAQLDNFANFLSIIENDF